MVYVDIEAAKIFLEKANEARQSAIETYMSMTNCSQEYAAEHVDNLIKQLRKNNNDN